MSLPVPIPPRLQSELLNCLRDIVRRAIDGSVNPIQISVAIRVVGNDIIIATGGNGLILTSRNGSHTGRLVLENPDSNGNLVLSVDPLT